MIGLALQGPSIPGLQLVQNTAGRPASALDMGYTYQHPLQARGPTREYATNKGRAIFSKSILLSIFFVLLSQLFTVLCTKHV